MNQKWTRAICTVLTSALVFTGPAVEGTTFSGYINSGLEKVYAKTQKQKDAEKKKSQAEQDLKDKDLNKKLVAALIKDLNNVKKIKKDEYDYSIDINYTDSGDNYNYRNGTEISVNIYSEYKNTLKVLNDSGVLAKLEE